MQILAHNFVPPRKKGHEVINPKAPTKPCRVRLTRDCVVWSGPVLGRKDDVYEFDLATPEGHEAVACLCSHSTSGVKVPLSTALRTAPAPVAPPPLPVQKEPSLKELIGALTTAFKASKA